MSPSESSSQPSRTTACRSPSSQFYEERRTVPGTKEDYETLFSSVKITGYKDLSLKEFNELVLNWGNKYFNAYESITEDTARSEFPMFWKKFLTSPMKPFTRRSRSATVSTFLSATW